MEDRLLELWLLTIETWQAQIKLREKELEFQMSREKRLQDIHDARVTKAKSDSLRVVGRDEF